MINKETKTIWDDGYGKQGAETKGEWVSSRK
jgi:hypothetical protein